MRMRRRVSLILIALAIVTAIVCIVAPIAARRIVRSRLQAMIASQLNAELQIGGLTYTFPYGVQVSDAAIVTRAPDGETVELLRLSGLSLKLARSPLRRGPLVIERIEIDGPAIHLIRMNEGLIGRRGLAKTDASTSGGSSTPSGHWKLSDMFRLRELDLRDGSVVYEDRTLHGTRPLVWRNLQIHLDTVPESGSAYAFHFTADDSPLARLDATGAADIDSLVLSVSKCGLAVTVDPSRDRSALPPEYQRMLGQFGVRGDLAVNVSATLPLTDPSAARYDASLDLHDAAAKLPELAQPIRKLALRVRADDRDGVPSLRFEGLHAVAGDVQADLTGGSIALDPNTMVWKLAGLAGQIRDISAGGSLEFALEGSAPLFATDVRQVNAKLRLTPHDLAFRPPGFAGPVNQFVATDLSLRDGVLSSGPVRAAYGNDIWFVRQASLDLTGLPRALTVHHAEGCLTFGLPRMKYPPVVEQYLAQADPGGPWFFEADPVVIPLNRRERPDYRLTVHTARGRLAVEDGRVPIYNINTGADLTPRQIELRHFEAGCLRGEIRASGEMRLDGSRPYSFTAAARNIELSDLMRALTKPGQKPPALFGYADVLARGDGSIPDGDAKPLNGLRAAGNFEVRNGDFWTIPVFQQIADNAGVRSALTLGEAAGVFDISGGLLHLHPFAVSAPALGIEGGGAISFQGALDLNVVATPLGDWGDKADSSALRDAARAVQGGINRATGEALYTVHVGGTADRPDIQAVPTPFLTRQASNLFDFLKSRSGDGRLLDFVRNQPATQPAD